MNKLEMKSLLFDDLPNKSLTADTLEFNKKSAAAKMYGHK